MNVFIKIKLQFTVIRYIIINLYIKIIIFGIDLSTWSGREKIWYFGEKKLLFASTCDREIELWISIINILKKLTDSSY